MAVTNHEYYLVKSEVLPEIFLKVMEAKRLLSTGEAQSVNEASLTVGISRSAYYKYKDAILPFYDSTSGHVVTLSLSIENLPGTLASILASMADVHANVLTINQGIPIYGLAELGISIETRALTLPLNELIARLGRVTGVRSCRILARGDD